MKKFLAILLIAIIACETVQEFDSEDWINPLESAGIYDLVLQKLINYGRQVAVNFCAQYLSRSTCESEVDALIGGGGGAGGTTDGEGGHGF